MQDSRKSVWRQFPRSFWAANAMEIFERMGWYGFYAVSTLYLTNAVTDGGLGFSSQDRGVIQGLATFFLYLFPAVFGALADRYGYKRMFLASVIVMAPTYILLAAPRTFWGFLSVYFLVAVGHGMFKPVVISTVAKTTDEKTGSMGFGIFYMSGLNEMLARGMELSVLCAEDYPFIDMSADYSDTLIGNLMLEIIDLQCSVWPHGDVPQDYHQPVVSDLPVLLMSGERDPVTPPHYAATAAETFSNSLNLVARGQSHSVMKNTCLRDITTEFINSGSIEDLDITCVEDIRSAPFFTSLLGPDP